MKKGFVALLLILALVVLVSPGIIGRLAEQSVDENFERAAFDSGEVIVTSTGFDGGWFTSAGQHRVELRQGELYYMLLASFENLTIDSVPMLLIDTRLDHGLVPVSSMSRENGSLMPGLGSAVSTLSIELADGSVVPLPGTLYSTVGLMGELRSRFELAPEGLDAGGARINWGGANFLLTSDPRSGDLSIDGALSSLSVEADEESVTVGKIGVDFDLAQSGFGYLVGPAKFTLDSVAVVGAEESVTVGPFYMDSSSNIDNGRLDADLTLRIENAPMPIGGMPGSGGLQVVARLENVDAAALGKLKHSIEAMRNADYEQMAMIDIESDMMRLLASGMTLHFDQLDIASPLGQITSRFSASLDKSAADDFSWASALLALDASVDLSLPAELVDMATKSNPDLHAAIGLGFLRKQGDDYVMKATFKKGLLNVNGAPMQIPLTGLQ